MIKMLLVKSKRICGCWRKMLQKLILFNTQVVEIRRDSGEDWF